jgi:soluble lytic murein transglycosylase
MFRENCNLFQTDSSLSQLNNANQRLKNVNLLVFQLFMKKLIIAIIFAAFLLISLNAQVYNDATLSRVREQDRVSRDKNGKLPTLGLNEHLYRADVYSSNRAFGEAREHWEIAVRNFRNDPAIAKAMFGIGRSYMWERQYSLAVTSFDELFKSYPETKDGREGLAFKGASLVRLGKNDEAAKVYEQYTIMFPNGEKIDSAYQNMIDALREAGKYDDASIWVDKTRTRFVGSPTEVNRGLWDKAIATADELRNLRNFSGSMTSFDEVTFLKALAFDKAGKRNDAISTYSSITDSPTSYYGSLATEKLFVLSPNIASFRLQKISSSFSKLAKDFPALFRTDLLTYAKTRNIDPRFVLAIMKQESSFNPNAKSPAAARGLLQLTMDTALKYNTKAGFPNLQAEQLYKSNVNIAIASVYLADLKQQFGGLYEAIAASYNGGEDNATRWLNRSKPKENAIFAAETGFGESKNYIFKVMTNYRIYRELYTDDLKKK